MRSTRRASCRRACSGCRPWAGWTSAFPRTSSCSTTTSRSTASSSAARPVSSPEAAARANATGAQFLTEIRAQPQALAGLLEHQSTYARVAAAARDRGASVVRMVGHGSSDNAASYGVYALGLLPRWTAMRDSITLTVYYDAGVEMKGSTVIGLSQSGRTPDVSESVRRARGAGAFTVALTNDVGSDLAGEAEAVLPLAAGPERSVAATETYLNQVAALVASGTAAAALDGAAYALPVPEPPEPLLSPLLSVVPGQLFASALAAAKGLDPDRPNGLSKVTLAR